MHKQVLGQASRLQKNITITRARAFYTHIPTARVKSAAQSQRPWKRGGSLFNLLAALRRELSCKDTPLLSKQRN
jgi:hypothetical protein